MIDYLGLAEMRGLIGELGVAEVIAGLAEEIENDYRRWPEFESSARLARRHERPSPSQKLAARLNRRSRSGHIGTRQRFFSRW